MRQSRLKEYVKEHFKTGKDLEGFLQCGMYLCSYLVFIVLADIFLITYRN